jgi:hypothetical protein
MCAVRAEAKWKYIDKNVLKYIKNIIQYFHCEEEKSQQHVPRKDKDS